MSWQDDLTENDFIIPDEEVPLGKPQTGPNPAQGAHNHSAPSQSTPKPASSRAGFPWAPSVDLSSAFTPFQNFSQSNKVAERRFAGGDTLDEPVWATLRRDLSQIGRRVAIVVWPAQLQHLARTQQQRFVELAAQNGLNLPSTVAGTAYSVPLDEESETGPAASNKSLDWDLWGPLLFSLAYAVTMGVASPNTSANVVFSGTFSFMWVFFLVAGINIQLLGGTISFLSAISATGYSAFPIVCGALISTLALKWRFVRLIVMSLCAVWSLYAASMSLKCSGVLPGRVLLALYPVALMYAVMSWLVVIT
ncbi:hypothetical protein OXX79_002891 [Metschnikowia pulcherrima]